MYACVRLTGRLCMCARLHAYTCVHGSLCARVCTFLLVCTGEARVHVCMRACVHGFLWTLSKCRWADLHLCVGAFIYVKVWMCAGCCMRAVLTIWMCVCVCVYLDAHACMCAVVHVYARAYPRRRTRNPSGKPSRPPYITVAVLSGGLGFNCRGRERGKIERWREE
jgi:hypothetical protein